MGLNKFRDTLSPVILHFVGKIGDGTPCGEISLIRCRRRFSYCAFDKHFICILVKAWSW
jgi:hypothetical protein